MYFLMENEAFIGCFTILLLVVKKG